METSITFEQAINVLWAATGQAALTREGHEAVKKAFEFLIQENKKNESKPAGPAVDVPPAVSNVN